MRDLNDLGHLPRRCFPSLPLPPFHQIIQARDGKINSPHDNLAHRRQETDIRPGLFVISEAYMAPHKELTEHPRHVRVTKGSTSKIPRHVSQSILPIVLQY